MLITRFLFAGFAIASQSEKKLEKYTTRIHPFSWCCIHFLNSVSTTKLPAVVFVYTQLDLNASWIAHSSFISRSTAGFNVLRKWIQPFLVVAHSAVVAYHSQPFTRASRNLLAATPILRQSCVKFSTAEMYDGNVLMCMFNECTW